MIELTIQALDEFSASCEQLIHALEAFGSVSSDWRRLSTAGNWMYDLARWCGFASLDILAWLETCPGAFADEPSEWQED